MTEKEYGIDNWAPLFSSPEAEQAYTAATMPPGERQAYLDSLPPVTQQERDRPYYGTGQPKEPDREAGTCADTAAARQAAEAGEREAGQLTGHGSHDYITTGYERAGAAAEAEQERQFADFWGGQGPDYEAMADRDAPESGPDSSQWWDGERIHYGDKGLEAGQ